jgi:hypothetical protein
MTTRRLSNLLRREFSLAAEAHRWVLAGRMLRHRLSPARAAPPRPCRCWFCRMSGPAATQARRVFAVYEWHGGRERLVYDGSGVLCGWVTLATGAIRVYGPPPADPNPLATAAGATVVAVSTTPGQWAVYDTVGGFGLDVDRMVPYRWDGHRLERCPVIGSQLPPWAREVAEALAAVGQWRDRLPPWPADQLIDLAAHQPYTRPVPDNPEFRTAGCSCGWDSLIVTTEDHQRDRFDGHMIGLQIAARAVGPRPEIG